MKNAFEALWQMTDVQTDGQTITVTLCDWNKTQENLYIQIKQNDICLKSECT